VSHANPSDPAYLARLRAWRGPRSRDDSLRDEMARLARSVRTQSRATEGIGAVWTGAAPAELVAKVEVIGVRRGVLTLRPDCASTRYELDRWLRQGGEQKLMGLAPVTLTRVRLVSAG
jgi:hypothetical protein